VTLGRGTVSGLQIGACVQSEGFDIDTLRGEVQYRDNGRNLDTTELPVPSIGGEVVVP
jgi:hypothetical protein